MKKLVLGTLVAALCAVPNVSRAATPKAHRAVSAPAPREAQPAPASDPDATGSDANDYAAREKAAPKDLAKFSGGDNGVYIGGGAILVALLVVLLITAL